MALPLILLLDRSGSMYNTIDDTLGGFNSFIDESRIKTPDSLFSLYTFSDTCQIVHDNVPLSSVPTLTRDTYVPFGSTSLFDAMGEILLKHKDGKFIIITDGCENTSTKFHKGGIKMMIEESNLEIVYIGADIDQATDMGISKTHEYNDSAEAFRCASQSI